LTLLWQINSASSCYQAEISIFGYVLRLRRKESWLANQQNDDNDDENEANPAPTNPDYAGTKWQ
jgi:hypothetical protein